MRTHRLPGTTPTVTTSTTSSTRTGATGVTTAPPRARSTTSRTGLLASGVVAAALVLAACGGEDATTTGSTENAPSSASSTSGTAADHNATDVEFATMMIPHHAEAVEMASTVLAKEGLDPRVAEIAQQVQAAQAPEIELMSGWLREWGEPVPDTSGSMAGMEMDSPAGSMSAEDVQALQDAPGTEAARLFLEQMTEHHNGAIEMADQQITDGRYPAAVDLARAIVTSQEKEISRMQALLEQL